MSTTLNLYHHAEQNAIASRIAERLQVPVNPYTSDQAQLSEISGSDALILVLSSALLPSTSSIKFWRPILEWLDKGGQSRVAIIMADECEYPSLLDRATVIAWNPDPIAALRALERWVWRLDRQPGSLWRPHAAFVNSGAPQEAERLILRLADKPGQESATLELALDFTHQAAEQFQDIVWLDLAYESPQFAAMDLEKHLTDRRRLLLLYGYSGEPVANDYHNSILTIEVPQLRPAGRSHPLLEAASAFPPASIPVPLLLSTANSNLRELEAAIEARLFRWLDQAKSLVLPAVAPVDSLVHQQELARHLRRASEVLPILHEFLILNLAPRDWELASSFGLATISRLNDSGHKQAAIAFCELLRPHAEAANDQECLRELAWFIDVAIMPAAASGDGEQMSLF